MNNFGEVGAGHVLGRYELLMPIASGGMATVWAARLKGSRGFQKIVAVKTILPQLVDDPRFDQMFLDEASLASKILHPNVVEILDLGEQDGVLYLVMEWVDGEPISVLLKAASRAGGMPIPIVVRIMSQACAGLHAAHELRDESGTHLGLVHRDVSPQNLLVTFDGVVKVVDFGVAKATGRASIDTNPGQIKGKAAYMSPEQARGVTIDRRTDVFALGIVLYLTTTGRHPFRGENDLNTLHKICSPEPTAPPSAFVPGYPRALEDVVMRAIAKAPEMRFPTANEMRRALEHSLPDSMRIVTDDVVADFVRGLLGQRQEQRQRALRAAQRIADERTAGRVRFGPSPTLDAFSHSGFTPPSQSGFGPPDLRPSNRPTVVTGPATPGSMSGTTASAANRSSPDVEELLVRPKRSRSRYVLGVAGVLAAAGAGLVALAGPSTDDAPAGSASQETAATSGTASAAGAPSALATAAPTREPPVAGEPGSPGARLAANPQDQGLADAGQTAVSRGRTPIRQPVGRPSGNVKGTSGSTTSPATTSTTFMSPVRNPGF